MSFPDGKILLLAAPVTKSSALVPLLQMKHMSVCFEGMNLSFPSGELVCLRSVLVAF